MATVEGEDTAAATGSNTLSADELESWTLLDSSPRRSPNPAVQVMESQKKNKKDSPSRVEDEDETEEEEEEVEEGEDVSEAESASEEGEVEEAEEEQEEVDSAKEKTSRVEVVQEKGASARDTRQDDAGQQKKSRRKHRKKRTDSERSVDSHDEYSSDGISVISESDGTGSDTVVRSRDQRKLHLAKGIRLEPVDSPLPSELDLKTQLSRKNVSDDDESKQLVREDAMVPWGSVSKTSVVVLGVFVTAVAAVLIGNSRLYTNRIDEYNFQHEQRISELELENNILKNEMNKLKHLYTRSELDEQVQQADTEWSKVLEEKLAEEQAQVVPEPEPEAEPETPTPEPLTFRKVPPQDEDVKHKVVWSGDDGQPMLIADKDYVLPDFCFNKNAVQDDLFSEYSGKYCDIKKRKIEAKQRKAEFARKNHKRYRGEQKDYAEYIIPTKEEVDEYQRQATATPPKPPSLSPFDFDYQKAFETIKEEGAVIVDSLVAILDLDPEPEYLPTASSSPSTSSLGTDQESSSPSSSYQADDEASPSSSATPSTESVPSEIRWESYPPWVRQKYESQPEMYAKLRHKESLLWDWERKKNEFLHQVGLETLEEVDRKSEDELRQRRDEFRSKGRQQQQQQSGEWRKEEHRYKERKHDGRKEEEFRGKKYDERRGKERYDERKEWKDRSRDGGENRSRDHKDHHNQHNDQDHHQQQPWKKDEDKRKPEHHGESSKEWRNDSKEQHRKDGSRESSGAGKPYHKKESGEYRKNHSGERDGKPYYKKDGKESSGDGGKRYKKDWKDGSGERDGKPYHKKQWKESSGEHSGEAGKRKDSSGERKQQHEDERRGGGAKRNGDQWNWSKDHSGEDQSGEGSYLSQYRGEEDHHKKKQESGKFEGKRNFRDDDDDDDDDDHHHKKHHSKEDYQRKHHKDDDRWKRKKHHDGDRKWQEHSQEKRR